MQQSDNLENSQSERTGESGGRGGSKTVASCLPAEIHISAYSFEIATRVGPPGPSGPPSILSAHMRLVSKMMQFKYEQWASRIVVRCCESFPETARYRPNDSGSDECQDFSLAEKTATLSKSTIAGVKTSLVMWPIRIASLISSE